MLFKSNLLGEVEVDENTVITFDHGLPALENCTRFKLFHDAQSDQPSVFWMQSLDNPDVLLSLTDPAKLGIRYEIALSDDELASLALTRTEDAAVLLIIYRDTQPEKDDPAFGHMRANLRNPLVINMASCKGIQKSTLNCDILLHNRA